jgi:hypothetical protein
VLKDEYHQRLENGAAVTSRVRLWGSSKTLKRNRQPFVFTVRGSRKVKFRSGGRDETVVEEDGRKVRIFTELLGG